MSFAGFSEDDIRKLTKSSDTNKHINKGNHHKNAVKKVTFKPNSTVNHTRPKTILSNKNGVSNTVLPDIPENAKLAATQKPEVPVDHKVESQVQVSEEKETSQKQTPVTESESQDRKFKDLDEFEAKQKLIEEQNRKRKELLAKALADRTKRTQEEAQRLKEIQEEFKKLDDMLCNDVKILRKQIELASIDYMECQKRYHKIEKEFLDVKLLLHQKQEKKELLTEHLCAIIEKNEERKAEKLNELLQKLQLASPADSPETNDENKKGSIEEARQ